MTTSAIYEIAKSVTDHLKDVMQTELNANDLTRAGVARIGLLQQSPLTGGINILTNTNDPDDDKGWRNSVTAGPGDSMGLNMEKFAYEIGGGSMWYRRYTTRLDQFFKASVDRVGAEQLSAIIMSRAEQAIIDAPLIEDADSFGEIPLKSYIHSTVNVEGGGPGQFIYHGMIYWFCLTEKTGAGN